MVRATVNGKRLRPRPLSGVHAFSTGFTYIGLLVFIALLSIGLSATGVVFHQQSRREKEKQLLFAGDEIRRAIGTYYEQSPGGQKRFPQTLEDLLLDRRHASVQRHLRRIYTEPMSGTKEWVLIPAPDGGIMGVRSGAAAEPLKTARFPVDYEAFKDKSSYSEWTFQYTVTQASATAAVQTSQKGSEAVALPSSTPGAVRQRR